MSDINRDDLQTSSPIALPVFLSPLYPAFNNCTTKLVESTRGQVQYDNCDC